MDIAISFACLGNNPLHSFKFEENLPSFVLLSRWVHAIRDWLLEINEETAVYSSIPVAHWPREGVCWCLWLTWAKDGAYPWYSASSYVYGSLNMRRCMLVHMAHWTCEDVCLCVWLIEHANMYAYVWLTEPANMYSCVYGSPNMRICMPVCMARSSKRRCLRMVLSF